MAIARTGGVASRREMWDDLLIESSDYRFRVFVEKYAWVQVVAALADEIDYDNFKTAVASPQGRDGTSYERTLHQVWEVMYGLQHRSGDGSR